MTSVCNLRCVLCSRTAGRVASAGSPGAMADGVWRTVVEAAARVGKVCPNGWGENFTDPRFLDRLEELDRLGVETGFSTNGTLVTSGHAARLARLARLVSVNVSLDTADPDAYRSLRGMPLAAALRGAAALAAEPGLAGKVTASAIVRDETAEGVGSLPSLLASIGVRGLVLQRFVGPWEPEAPPGCFADARVVSAVGRVEEECRRLGIDVLVVPFLLGLVRGMRPEIWAGRSEGHLRDEEDAWTRVPLTRQCGSPWESAVFDKDGRVFPCCIAPDRGEEHGAAEAVVGDLSRQSFAEVWGGEQLRRFRLRLLSGDLPAVCRSCPVTSTGPHFFLLYAAEVEGAEAAGAGRARITVRNRGAVDWTGRTLLRIGTTRPRNRVSALASAGWLTPFRTASFCEERVRPGERATFDLELMPGVSLGGEPLQLVVEGACWIPGTEFVLEERGGALGVRHLETGRDADA